MFAAEHRATGRDVAFALIAGPGIGLVAVLATATILAGIPEGYVLGALVAPGVTAWYARRRGRSVATTLALATASLAVMIVVVWLLLLLLIIVFSQGMGDLD